VSTRTAVYINGVAAGLTGNIKMTRIAGGNAL
jgi:hypothetical protein